MLFCSVDRQGLGILARLSPHPASFPEWGVCTHMMRRDSSSSMSSCSGRRPWCMLASPSQTTFWVQARRCRHAFRIPPEKRDLQVPSQGRGAAKPQLCAFLLEEGKVGGERRTGLQLWKAFSPHMNLVSRSLCVTLGIGLPPPAWSWRPRCLSLHHRSPFPPHLL